ncbi:MAG TPA: hypothetical protein VI612_04115 [Candidatus Nanoarchaeia archaeon]|nr:hypothetical protein [Candidatus Nanoarchaeia archaeon]
MRGKKGLDYAIILLFVFGILIVALFLAQSKTTQVCAEGSQAPACAGLGSAQAPVLMVNSRTKLVDIFVKSAATLAMDKTVNDVALYPYYQGFTGEGTSNAGFCPTLNSEERPREIKRPALAKGITTSFNSHFDKYIESYNTASKLNFPKSNYELYVEKGEVSGVALRPSILPLKNFKKEDVGTISYHSSFKLNYNHKFEDYPIAFDRIAEIAQDCVYSSDPKVCAEGRKLPGWTIEKTDNMLRFQIPRGAVSSCYLLVLPRSSLPTT